VNTGKILLDHMIEHPTGCDDPDCELHNVELAIEEGVWDSVAKAFFLAGWLACQRHFNNAMDEVMDEATKDQFEILGIDPANYVQHA